MDSLQAVYFGLSSFSAVLEFISKTQVQTVAQWFVDGNHRALACEVAVQLHCLWQKNNKAEDTEARRGSHEPMTSCVQLHLVETLVDLLIPC